MRCPFCGETIEAGNVRCPHCLNRLEDAQAQADEQDVTPLKDVTPNETTQQQASGPYANQQPYGQNPYANQQAYGQNPYANQQAYGQNPYANQQAYGQPPYAAPNMGGYKPPQPPSHLVGSILNTFFCCQPGGIVAICFSALSMSKYSSGDYQGAEQFSRWASITNKICFFGFIAMMVLIFILALTGVLADLPTDALQ